MHMGLVVSATRTCTIIGRLRAPNYVRWGAGQSFLTSLAPPRAELGSQAEFVPVINLFHIVLRTKFRNNMHRETQREKLRKQYTVAVIFMHGATYLTVEDTLELHTSGSCNIHARPRYPCVDPPKSS